MKLALSFCTLVLAGTTCFAAGIVFPETQIIDGAIWHYAVSRPDSIMCNVTQPEGSYWDTVFNILYTNKGIYEYRVLDIGEVSCINTVRDNPNYHKEGLVNAYCTGSLSDCIATLK